MLDEKTQSLWDEYLTQERQHVRSTYLAALNRFISAFNQLPEANREAWAKDIAKRVVDQKAEIPVRLPLFREVLFPALIAGDVSGSPGCARWLAGFESHLVHTEEIRKYIPKDAGPAIYLLHKALERDPNDSHARRMLISRLSAYMEYSLHEIPAGVLYDFGFGASMDQCTEMIRELDEFCDLVETEHLEDEHQELIGECRLHYPAYRDYLENQNRFSSYAAYLSEKFNLQY
jgi:hypothetical protein